MFPFHLVHKAITDAAVRESYLPCSVEPMASGRCVAVMAVARSPTDLFAISGKKCRQAVELDRVQVQGSLKMANAHPICLHRRFQCCSAAYVVGRETSPWK